MLLGAILAGTFSLLTTWLTNYSVSFYIAGRVLMFACIHGSQLAQFCYMMEMLPPAWRTPLGIIIQDGFSLGFMSLSAIAMMYDNWQSMMLSISFYPFLMIFLFPFIPESYRWYFSRGYHSAGVAAVKQYTAKCGREMDENVIDKLIHFENDAQTDSEKATMADLFRRRATCVTSLKMVYLWSPGFLPRKNIFENPNLRKKSYLKFLIPDWLVFDQSGS